MTKDTLNNKYFKWMCQLVYHEKYSGRLSYQKLLCCLHSMVFVCTVGLDSNRAEDGVDLRYRFGYEDDYEDAMIASYLDDRPCSVLEMLVALALRCEEHIMDDPDVGNRTGQWFWQMLVNLGLESMNDRKFDIAYVNRVIQRFLNREYEPDGEGGLFTVKNGKYDLRRAEIWYQMCWYLDSVIAE